MFYTEPRYTKDIDIWVEPEIENAKRLWRALEIFGAPLHEIEVREFTDENLIYQIGVEPNRIDIIMGIEGVTFSDAWQNREHSSYSDVTINLISLQDLITAKEKTARPQDLLDLSRLRKSGP